MRIHNWKMLEETVKDILKLDNPVIPPLSGGTKKEEDVVGLATISQCKFTTKNNISIKDKDIKRLKKAASDLDKIPVFISSTENETLLSLLIDNKDDVQIQRIIAIITSFKLLEELDIAVGRCKTLKELKQCIHQYTKVRDIFNNVRFQFDELKDEINNNINLINNKLLMVDLFEDNKE